MTVTSYQKHMYGDYPIITVIWTYSNFWDGPQDMSLMWLSVCIHVQEKVPATSPATSSQPGSAWADGLYSRHALHYVIRLQDDRETHLGLAASDPSLQSEVLRFLNGEEERFQSIQHGSHVQEILNGPCTQTFP